MKKVMTYIFTFGLLGVLFISRLFYTLSLTKTEVSFTMKEENFFAETILAESDQNLDDGFLDEQRIEPADQGDNF